MKLKKIVLAIGLSCVSLSIYAADQVIKEETTPPASEGALTVDQIPPVYNQPQQTSAPTTTTTTTITPPGANTASPEQPMTQPMSGQNNQNNMESTQPIVQ